MQDDAARQAIVRKLMQQAYGDQPMPENPSHWDPTKAGVATTGREIMDLLQSLQQASPPWQAPTVAQDAMAGVARGIRRDGAFQPPKLPPTTWRR